jgi:hypothetical protein
MKEKTSEPQYYFVDESGDPSFYDRKGRFIVGKEGCSKILMLGFISTSTPDVLRSKLAEVKNSVVQDKYLKPIPSLADSIDAFHAKDDCPEVRERVFKAIANLPFKAEFIVARKKEQVFEKKHRKNPNLFYDDMVTKLFQNSLHKSDKNIIYFSVRGNSARQEPLENAVRAATFSFEKRWGQKIESEIGIFPQRPVGEPCLQVIDYMNWAVQRAFVRGEMRYLEFVREKISLIFDIYDYDKYPKNFYTRKNPFEANKISPL